MGQRGSSNGDKGVAARERRATLRDVAAAAGLSLGTASNALNGSPLVRPETRTRVLEAAQRLDYVPDRNASRLRHGRSDCIVVAGRYPPLDEANFYAMVVQGITGVLEEHGYAMRLVGFGDEVMRAATGKVRRRPLSAHDVDGIVVLNWQERERMERLRAIGVPLVAVDTSGAHPDVLSVDNDDRGGVASGTSYLIGLGHRRIAFLNEELTSQFGREAFAGYLQAYVRHRLPAEPWLLRTSDFTISGGRRAMAEILAGGDPPTAVIAVDDLSAIGAMQAIQEAGLRIPDDVSVVGMDDIPLAASVRPALTTVRIELEELGRRGTELLLQVIGGATPNPEGLVLPTRLVVRDSTAPPRR